MDEVKILLSICNYYFCQYFDVVVNVNQSLKGGYLKDFIRPIIMENF